MNHVYQGLLHDLLFIMTLIPFFNSYFWGNVLSHTPDLKVLVREFGEWQHKNFLSWIGGCLEHLFRRWWSKYHWMICLSEMHCHPHSTWIPIRLLCSAILIFNALWVFPTYAKLLGIYRKSMEQDMVPLISIVLLVIRGVCVLYSCM